MAWTTPRTWTTSEIVTASMMNTHVRDNLNETAPGKATAARQTVWSSAANAISMVTNSVYKTADETVNNSTTLQNDDHLLFSIAANEVWAFDMFMYYTIASGNPGVKWAFTVPASCTGWYQTATVAANIDAGGGTNAIFSNAIATTSGFTPTGLTSFLIVHHGNIVNSTNAGTIQFQWAQNAAVASDLKLKLGSYLSLKRLA